jgi:hypothetical protein
VLESRPMSAERRLECVLLAIATLGSGALTLRLGQDVNFDQVSYHIYLGWSLVADRLGKDVAPAGLGTFLNPLLQAVHYLGMTSLPTRVFFFLLGAVHGANAFLVYRLARHVLWGVARERALAVVAGAVAAAGPCAVSMLGTTFGDNVLSLLTLGALLLLVGVAERPDSMPVRRVGLAGALGGAAAGLKLTSAIGVVALLAAALLVALRLRRPRLALAFATGTAAGGIAMAGYWGGRMWRAYGDPLFPWGHALFPSRFALPTSGFDPRWALRTPLDLLATPFQLGLGNVERLQEVPARDVRYLLLFALLAAFAVRLSWPRPRDTRSSTAGAIVLVGWVALYLAWSLAFHYYRYFVVGEFLAPVAIVALLRLLAGRRLTIAWLAAAAVILATTTCGDWGRADWTPGPVDVHVPLGADLPPALVLVDGYAVSFALPFFPAGTRFLGLTGTGSAFQALVAEEVRRSTGPLYRVRLRALPPTPIAGLGLRDVNPCKDFRTAGRGRLLLCRLERIVPPLAPR